MTFGKGHDTPLDHRKYLCEILYRSEVVRRYGWDQMWTDSRTDRNGDSFIYCKRGNFLIGVIFVFLFSSPKLPHAKIKLICLYEGKKEKHCENYPHVKCLANIFAKFSSSENNHVYSTPHNFVCVCIKCIGKFLYLSSIHVGRMCRSETVLVIVLQLNMDRIYQYDHDIIRYNRLYP